MAVEKILRLLAALVALVSTAPAFLYLDLPVQVVISILLIAGFIIDQRDGRLLSPLPATLISFVFFFFYLAQMSRSNIVEPVVNMLVLLLAVRLVTEKSGRNQLQIFVLSTFILAASSLLSLSAGYLASLILLVTLVTFGLLLTSFYATDPNLRLNRIQWRSLLRTGSILPIGSLLLMLFFFLVLPRTQYPLWNFLNPQSKPVAGFSEEVNPGSLADLGSSGEPAFRAEMDEIDPQELYWRGLVLNLTDGRSWSRAKYPPIDLLLRENTTAQKQTIYNEPRTSRYLLGLDLPGDIKEIKNQRFADGVFESQQRLDKRIRFTVKSYLSGLLKLKNPQESEFYLRTPDTMTQRVTEIADEIATGEDRKAKIQAAKSFFTRQQLSYASRNLQRTETPVETFLFESKRGYCEYFASSFALLLRLAGVPARLVGGYLGGRYNQLGGYYLVDEDMAHVWVEALDDANHWQRIDPSRLAINAEAAVTGLSRSSFDWPQAAADYLENAWSRLVITYDLNTQLNLIFSTGNSLRHFRSQLPDNRNWWLSLAMVPVIIILFSKKVWKRPASQQRILKRYLAMVCHSAGLKQLPLDLGLFNLAEQSGEPLCHDFAKIFGQAVYHDEPLGKEQKNQLNSIIRQLAMINLNLTESSPPARNQRCSAEAMIDKSTRIP